MSRANGLSFRNKQSVSIFLITLSTPATFLNTFSQECDGVVADKESLDFCEKKKDKNKCEQFKMDCLVTCEFCNPNITTNVTTLPPTNITTLPPTTVITQLSQYT